MGKKGVMHSTCQCRWCMVTGGRHCLSSSQKREKKGDTDIVKILISFLVLVFPVNNSA